MYTTDRSNHRIRKIEVSTGIITTIAGTGASGYSGDGGQANSATVKYPDGINLDSAGNVYFGDDSGYNVIRKITVSTGVISTVAGTGSATGGYNGDNIQATAATLYWPTDVVLDSYDNLYICDMYNHRVRKVDASTGLISTVVGTGAASSSGDGAAATSATINAPIFCRLDSSGNLYFTEYGGNQVRKVITISTEIPTVKPTYYPSLSPHSITIISTIAGTGTASYSGDGGQATSAAIATPTGIAIDSSGNLYFSDFGNHRVRKITAVTGIISTYAGTGASSYTGDGGVANSAALYLPNGLCIDTSGIFNILLDKAHIFFYILSTDNIYIGDHGNNRIRKIAVSTSIISTIAGTGASAFSGDNGQATSAALYLPTGVAVDKSGKRQY